MARSASASVQGSGLAKSSSSFSSSFLSPPAMRKTAVFITTSCTVLTQCWSKKIFCGLCFKAAATATALWRPLCTPLRVPCHRAHRIAAAAPAAPPCDSSSRGKRRSVYPVTRPGPCRRSWLQTSAGGEHGKAGVHQLLGGRRGSAEPRGAECPIKKNPTRELACSSQKVGFLLRRILFLLF